MDNYAKVGLRKKVSRLIKRSVLIDKKIVLFGASVFSKEVKNCLTEQDFVISEIVDNDSRKIGTECMGLKVKRPETVLLPKSENFVILILSAGFYREMVYQLAKMGYVKNKNVFVLNFKINETLPVMAYMFMLTFRGFFAYRKFIKKSQTMFIAPYTGIGDIYLAGLFFNEYLNKNNIDNYVFIVVNGACKKVAEMFNIKNVIIVKPTITDSIIGYSTFLRMDWQPVVLNDGWLAERSQWIRGYKGLNFEKVFRYFVFGFDNNMRHKLPPRKNWQNEIDELFKKNNLIKGKMVILSPYSNTLFELPNTFWESIATHCKQLGYSVCTNCAAKNEKPVKGSEAVFFPLGMAIEFVEAAGCFIGIRSGLCDVISSAKAKKIILYEKDGFFYKSSPYEYFSLEKMGLCDDAVELEYSSSEAENIIGRILHAV